MGEKKFKGAPFGTQTARFDVSGIYPAYKRVGTYIEISYCRKATSIVERNRGPGTYNIGTSDFGARAVKKRARGPGWQWAQKSVRLAQTPHMQCRRTWENDLFLNHHTGRRTEDLEKRLQKILRVTPIHTQTYDTGKFPIPGSYKITPMTNTCPTISGSSVPLISSTPRTKTQNTNNIPGPATYTIPSFIDELEKKPGSNRGICATRANRFDESKWHTPGPRNKDLDKSLREIVKVTPIYRKTHYTGEPEHFDQGMDAEVVSKKRHKKKKQVGFESQKRFPTVYTGRVYLNTPTQRLRPVNNIPSPATYTIPSFIDKLEKKPASNRGICASRAKRFDESKSHATIPKTEDLDKILQNILKVTKICTQSQWGN